MKRLVPHIFLLVGFVLLNAQLFAQTISYSPTSNAYTINTAITAWTPSNTGTAVGIAGTFSATTTTYLSITAPISEAVDASANVYTLANTNKLYKGTSTTAVNSNTLTAPVGITTDGNLNVWVTDGVKIYEYASGGGTPTKTITETNSVRGIAADALNNIYIIENNTVREIVAGASTSIPYVTTGLTNAYGIAVDPSGNIFVSEITPTKAVVEIAAGGTTVSAFYSTGLTSPTFLDCDNSGNVYIDDNTANKILVISPSKTLLSTITAVTTPAGVAIDPTGLMYSGTASGTDRVLSIKPTGGYFISPTLPAGLSFNATNGSITGTPAALSTSATYAVNAWSATSTKGTASITISVINPPVLTYATPNVYTYNTAISSLSPSNSGAAVSALTGYGNASTLTITGIKGPEGMAADAAGNVYVCNFGTTTVTKYTNGVPASFISALTSPTGIVFDSAGNIYVLSLSGSIKKFPSTGGGTPSATITLTGATISNAYGLAIDASDNLYITNENSTGSIIKYNTTTGITTPLFISGGSLSSPSGVAVDASGNIFVLNNTGGGNVIKYDSNGANPTTFASGFTSPYGITIDNGGYIYVSDYGSPGNIKVYTPAGGTTPIATITGSTSCDGLTVDAQGNLYAANYSAGTNGNVTKYAPTGGYFINNLPKGLKFDGTTGIISGTPTAPQTSTAYNVTAYNATGSSNPTFNISVLPPVPTASGGTTMCPGTAILGATDILAGGTFTWWTAATSGTQLATGATYAPTVTTTTTYYVDYTVNGATSSTRAAVTVTINPPPDGTFTATPATVNVNTASINTNIAVTYTGTDPVTSTWAWDFNGGTPATGTGKGPFTVSWLTEGTKTVTLTITNANGCVTVATQTITVLQPPSISYSPSPVVFPTNVAISTYSPVNTGDAIGAFTSYNTGTTLTGPTFNAPYGMATDNSGNIYIANSSAGNILKFNSSGVYSGSAFISSVTNPVGLVFDSQGNCYVLSEVTNASKVYKYDSTGTLIGTAYIGSGLNTCFGIAIDAADNLYITNMTTGGTYTVKKYTTGGTTGTLVSGFNVGSTTQPYGIAIDHSGNIYIANHNSTTIFKCASCATIATGGTATSFLTGMSAPDAVSTDAAGNIYVGDSGHNLIKVYGPAGGTAVTTITITNPEGITVGNDGTLFATNKSGSAVNQYAPAGGYFIDKELPTGLTFDSTTGNITGTATATTTATNYTITAYSSGNPGGSSSTLVNISTQFSVPAISYTTPDSYILGTAITPNLTPANASNAVGTTFAYNGGTAFTGSASTPYAEAFDAQGNLYVANSAGNNILEYTNGALTAAPFITGVTNPTGIVFDSQGNCYVLSEVTNASIVYKYDSNGGSKTTWIGTGLKTSFGMAIDASDDLYITSYQGTTTSTYTVLKYNSSGTAQSLITLTHLKQPGGIAFGPTGIFYVLNIDGTVYKYAATGGTGTQFTASTFGTSSYGITTDAAGNVYIANSAAGTITAYTSGASLLGTISSLTTPRGITIDAQGNLYTNSGNTIKKYQPTGGYFLDTGLPLGLTLNSSTGVISGTPATSTAAADYTVTAWNAAGGGSTDINITCYSQFTWSSTSSTSWTTGSNWGGTAPGPGDQAVIGNSTSTTTYPIITGNTQVGSIVFNTKYAASHPPTLTINGGTLTVTGDITLQTSNTTATTVSLLGTGAISATNLFIKSTNTGATYTDAITSNLTNGLTLSGNLSLTTKNTTGPQNATFNLATGTSLTVNDVITSNVAGATSLFSFGNNSTVNFTDSDPLSGLSSTGTNNITIGTGTTIGYTGNNDQLFYTATGIPHSTLSSTGISYANLSFGGTGIKTPIAAGAINVGGNFTNTLANDATDFVDFSGNTVNFTGSSTQTIQGGPGSTAGTTFYNVNFNGGGAKTLTTDISAVASSGVLTMSGNTALASGGFLTLNSNANGSATVAAIPSGSGITGTVNVQRFITGGNINYRGYRLLSSAVSDPSSSPAGAYYNLSYLKGSGTFLTGASGGGFDATGNPTIYLYNEGAVPDNSSFTTGNYRAVTAINNSPAYNLGTIDMNHNMPVGNGFMFFYRGNYSSDATVVPSSLTFSSPGNLNQGPITVNTWNGTNGATFLNFSDAANMANSAVKGFNLVGNPYPSTINWETFNTSSNTTGIYAPANTLSNTIYTINPLSHLYATYMTGGGSTNSGSNFIVSGQGFFVQAVATGAQLIFNESAKASTQPGTLLLNSAAPVIADQHLRLKLVQDSVNTEDIYLGFRSNASSAYVFNEDAPYLFGNGSVSLSSFSTDKRQLAINFQPLPKQSLVIPINAGVSTLGVYQLNLTEAVGIPPVYDVWLEDTFLKDSLDLKHNPLYSYNVINNPASYNQRRFNLIIRQNPALGVHLLSFAAAKETDDVKLNWTVENESNYTHYTLQRSTDGGKSFTTIDTLTSAALGTYTDLDLHPVTGPNLYRLEQVDVLGNISYSSVVTIMYAPQSSAIASASLISVYPNPVDATLNLAISQPVTPIAIGAPASAYAITIVNSTGTVVKKSTSAQPQWQSDVSNLSPGTYFIQVINSKNNQLVGKSTFVKL